MELEKIKKLLRKYENGESSVEEDISLKEYFHSNKVDPLVSYWQPFFEGVEELRNDNKGLSDWNPENLSKKKKRIQLKRIRISLTSVATIAACLILYLTIYQTKSNPNIQWKDTYSTPQQAYQETMKTLRFVASTYQEGMQQLKPINKVQEAIAPLQNSLSKIDNEISKLTKLNL